jgi:hypothetical protein
MSFCSDLSRVGRCLIGAILQQQGASRLVLFVGRSPIVILASLTRIAAGDWAPADISRAPRLSYALFRQNIPVPNTSFCRHSASAQNRWSVEENSRRVRRLSVVFQDGQVIEGRRLVRNPLLP